MARTSAPTNVSMMLRCMRRFARQILGGAPGLVIARRLRALAAAIGVARRPVGERRARLVRLVRLLPGPGRLVAARHDIGRAMQPGIPLRRHLRGLGLALIEDPAALQAHRARILAAVIAIAEGIGADRLASQPGIEPGTDRHLVPSMPRRRAADYGTARLRGARG